MGIPYSLRRRRQTLASVVFLLFLFGLLRRYSRSVEGPITTLSNDTCVQRLTELEETFGDWSGFSLIDREIGDDVVESVLKLNEFEQCVLTNVELDPQQTNNIQRELFPYLDFDKLTSSDSQFWPVRKRWNGEVYRSSFPRFSLIDNSFQGVRKIEYNGRLSFWGNWLKNLMPSGSKGIVLSAGAAQVDDTIKLIRVLRHLKNTLPIEIVHKDDLTEEQERQLIKAAREEVSHLYPAQELWLTNVVTVLKPIFVARFVSFSNKWLALIFSSFEAPILLDSDVISFISLEQYYDSPHFKKMGTLFFKDRKVITDLFTQEQRTILTRMISKLLKLDFSNAQDPDSFRSILYSKISDEIAVETVQNLLQKGYKHHMESGLVLIDKRKHLLNLLTSVTLQFSSIKDYFHGDKEWFWLAQLLREYPFTFHPKDASNVGKLGKVISNEPGELYQVCSVQLSHTDTDGSLLWINGGLRTCKKDSWAADFKNNKRISSMFDSAEEVRKYYSSPVKLEGAIIPNVDVKPWIQIGECSMFSYCTLYKAGVFGEICKFNESQKRAYEEIVRIWNLPL